MNISSQDKRSKAKETGKEEKEERKRGKEERKEFDQMEEIQIYNKCSNISKSLYDNAQFEPNNIDID